LPTQDIEPTDDVADELLMPWRRKFADPMVLVA
jgi:hypothetical protein